MASNMSIAVGLVLFSLVSTGFVIVVIGTVRLLAPRAGSKAKFEPYECGEKIIGKPWVQIHVRYYIYAMLFLIFDVETVFLFPWAYYYGRLGVFGLIEMLVFLTILAFGLIFPWGKGVLTWDYSTKKSLKDRV